MIYIVACYSQDGTGILVFIPNKQYLTFLGNMKPLFINLNMYIPFTLCILQWGRGFPLHVYIHCMSVYIIYYVYTYEHTKYSH